MSDTDMNDEQVIKKAKTELASKSLSLKLIMSDEKYTNERTGRKGLGVILGIDASLHPLFQRCKFGSDLSLSAYMDQQQGLPDYDKKIMKIKEEYDVLNVLHKEKERQRSRSRDRGRKKKKKKHKKKSARKSASDDDSQSDEFETSSSDGGNDNTSNPYSHGYDCDTIKQKLDKKNRKRMERQICPDAKGSDFTVICLKQFVSDGGVQFETRNARMAEFLRVSEYKADKFNNWRQLDIYNEALFAFLFKAVIHMYTENTGCNNAKEYKEHVDTVRLNLLDQFEKVIGLYVPEKINVSLISVINNGKVNINNIVTETKELLSSLTSDSNNLIDSKYIPNGSLQRVCISFFLTGVCEEKDCTLPHECIMRSCKNAKHNISKCFGLKMPTSTRITMSGNIDYNVRKEEYNNGNNKTYYQNKRSYKKRRYKNNNNYYNKPFYQKHNPFAQQSQCPPLDQNWQHFGDMLKTIAHNFNGNNDTSNNGNSNNANGAARRGRGRGN